MCCPFCLFPLKEPRKLPPLQVSQSSFEVNLYSRWSLDFFFLSMWQFIRLVSKSSSGRLRVVKTTVLLKVHHKNLFMESNYNYVKYLSSVPEFWVNRVRVYFDGRALVGTIVVVTHV